MDPLDILATLNNCQNHTVLVVGDVMLDRYVWGNVTRLSPEAPIPIVSQQRTSAVPGGAANVASGIAALGGSPILVSVTGDDRHATALSVALQERGVNTDHLVCCPGRLTTVKTRIIAHHQQLLRLDEEDVQSIDSSLGKELAVRIVALLPSVTAVIISDYAKGVLTVELLATVIEQARNLRLPVAVDPKGRDYGRYNGASLLTPNRSEAYFAAGMHPDFGENVADVGNRLLDSLAIDALLITEGEAGMTLFERCATACHLPAAARAVYDVTGAGDTVIAAIGLTLSAGASLRSAAYLANLAGGIAVEQLGTAGVTAAQLRAAISDTGRGLPTFSEVRLDRCIQ